MDLDVDDRVQPSMFVSLSLSLSLAISFTCYLAQSDLTTLLPRTYWQILDYFFLLKLLIMVNMPRKTCATMVEHRDGAVKKRKRVCTFFFPFFVFS